MKTKIALIIFSAALLVISASEAFSQRLRGKDYGRDSAGAVYVMTNASEDNEIVIFSRDDHGFLTKVGSTSTGGAGSGNQLDPLGSQGSLVLSPDHRWLFAVNAGSNEISVFRVLPEKLKLVDKVDSGGVFPVSLTVFHDLVYVLNAGMSPNITGFYLSHRGKLMPLDKSTRLLGSGGFAQVGFDPRGEMIVVTDKTNNEILTYSVGRNGLPGIDPVISPSYGLVPFGFIFDARGHLLVAEAGSGAVSTYAIQPDGALQGISLSVLNGQQATCWIAANQRANVFTANTGSQNISSYKLAVRNGNLTLSDATAGFGNRPIDLALSIDGRFLYALDPAQGGIDVFRIDRDGGLTDLGPVNGNFSIFAQGIAAR